MYPILCILRKGLVDGLWVFSPLQVDTYFLCRVPLFRPALDLEVGPPTCNSSIECTVYKELFFFSADFNNNLRSHVQIWIRICGTSLRIQVPYFQHCLTLEPNLLELFSENWMLVSVFIEFLNYKIYRHL